MALDVATVNGFSRMTALRTVVVALVLTGCAASAPAGA